MLSLYAITNTEIHCALLLFVRSVDLGTSAWSIILLISVIHAEYIRYIVHITLLLQPHNTSVTQIIDPCAQKSAVAQRLRAWLLRMCVSVANGPSASSLSMHREGGRRETHLKFKLSKLGRVRAMLCTPISVCSIYA